MNNKKQILTRGYILYVGMCVFALAIIVRIVTIQFVQGDEWKQRAQALTTSLINIEAVRGNIFDANGALLATSLPYYEVGVDICAPSIDDKLFSEKKDSLAMMLSSMFRDKSQKEYLKMLNKARQSKDRYIVLQRNVCYKDLQIIKTFPLLRRGKRGGLVTLQTNRRERPFKWLAARTIGMARAGIKPVGLEGAFDSVLSGTGGKRLMQRIAGDVWRPINDENEVEPKDGSDLYTTIDINIQDVAEHALMKALIRNQASHGCCVLMEVRTGAIKAIANLKRSGKDTSTYEESFNYAIGYPSEPGSTFKLASFLALFDSYDISLDEKVTVGNGECMYFDRKMKDSHPPKNAVMTAQEIFENSSNVGTSKLVTKYFSRDPKEFVNKLRSFHLHEKLGLSIPGEGVPRIKQTKDKDWYGTSLPWISIGYESKVTPLQTLALYNAIANNGTMVKPMFVKEIRRNGITVEKFQPEVIATQIVKPSAVEKAKTIMEGVVKNGSGRGINISAFRVGGKTGTAQILKNGNYKDDGFSSYQATFVGYFPADKPLYSCIVVVYEPSRGNYYGGLVAAPVFKEVAEKVYSGSVDFIQPVNSKPAMLSRVPEVITSKGSDLNAVAKSLQLPAAKVDADKYVSRSGRDSANLTLAESTIEVQLKKGIMPNLTGLSAKDALFLLENHGLYVKIQGFGIVRKQSIEAGQKIEKGNKVILTLS